MKKTLAWILVLALIAAAAVIGTVAYLTDEVAADNVMTIGKVAIELLEYERIDTETKNDDAKVQEFTPNKPLLPAVVDKDFNYSPSADTVVDWEHADKDGNIIKSAYTSPIWDPAKINNEVDKMVFLKNTGDYGAYVRLFFAFEAGKYATLDDFQENVHLNLNDKEDWEWEWTPFLAEIDGEKYFIAKATYQTELEPDEVTDISLSQIALDSLADNEAVEAFGNDYKVLVRGQGIQSAGFTDPDTALDEGFGRDIPFEKLTLVAGIDLKTALHNLNGDDSKPITSKVATVTFGLNETYPNIVKDNVGTFTSVEQDAMVYTYYVPNETDNTKYDVYVLADSAIYTPKDSKGLFSGMSALTTVDTTNMDVSRTENMYTMFYNCTQLTSIDVSKWNTENVTNMGWMFANCSNLTSLDVSKWNTGSVKNFGSLFRLCHKLASLDVSNWDTSSATDMSYLFNECQAINGLDVSGWDVSNVTNMRYVFYDCESLTAVNASNWDVGNVELLGGMFEKCYKLVDLNVSNWDLKKAYEMSVTFRRCESLESLDLSGWKTPAMLWTNGMFELNGKLKTLKLGEGWNTSKTTHLFDMFNGCSSLTTLDMSNWNTSNFIDVHGMFSGCTSLTTLDVSKWNTANVTNMASLFSNCSSLATINVSGWNTDKVKDMSFMFDNCKAVTELKVSGFNTAAVTNMASMFNNCFLVPELAVSGWNTANVTNMSYMFHACVTVTGLDLSNWNTANVTNMENMFSGCRHLNTLDVSGWNTAKVTTMESMFELCDALKALDLSSWNTNAVKRSNKMFADCSNLVTISVGDSWDMSNATSSADMFLNCVKLVGGAGTAYNESNANDNTYAIVDGTDGIDGYLTLKTAESTTP